MADAFLNVCTPDLRATLYLLRKSVHRNARDKGHPLTSQDFSATTDPMEANRAQWPAWVAPLDFGETWAGVQARARCIHAACFSDAGFDPWPLLVAHANRPERLPAVHLV